MIPLANSSTSRLASPFIWVAAGSFVFFAAWLFPSKWYTDIYRDENFIFFDVKSFVYCSLCIAATIAGLNTSLYRKSRIGITAVPVSPLSDASLTELMLILVCLLLTLGSLAVLYTNGAIGAFGAAVSSTGEGMSQEFRHVGDDMAKWETLMVPVSFVFPLLYFSARSSVAKSRNRIFFYLLVALYVLVAIITTKRNFLVRPAFSCLLVFLVWPSMRRFSINKGIVVSASAALICLMMFVILAIVRFGADGMTSSVFEVGRYLITPYNTASLVINDVVRMPGSRTGYYSTQFIWQFPIISEQMGLESIRESLFGDRPLHGALERGPLLKSYGITTGTAIPAFACSYIDFWWLGILPFFASGILCGLAWRSFLLGRVTGLCFYPVIAYSFLEWRGNLLFPPPTLGVFLAVYLVVVFCRFVEVRIKRPDYVR